MSDPDDSRPHFTRRSPLEPMQKLCPKCLKPLQKGGKFGGWLVPQDYYCPNCGYSGMVYLEKPYPHEEKD
ncbi:MAG: hypothetical protein LYZ70_06755 [Nitrososphaerales archaeon]|nr:hypothetical protein [Nitrososphaerales archaeon]